MSPRLRRRRAVSPMALVVAVISLVAGMLTVAPAAPAQAAELPSSILEGGFIISDKEFFDSGSMTAAQIQTFLNARVSTCKAAADAPTCLKSFKTDLPKLAADKYCKAIAAKKGATAAEVIFAAAKACSINPKVIIAMLQKEQGLVTSTAPSEWAYRAAMGQACPDTAPCDEAAAGFVNQVYKGARQMQVYTQNPKSFNYRAGQVNTIKWHPTSSCGSSKVFIQNQATANLYIYTPYRANVAALAAGFGTGDACSTYGNRNFYNYYVNWFAPGSGAATGAPAQIAECTVPVKADITAASGTATVKAATTGKKGPTKNCGSTTALAKNAKVTITGTYGAWMRVKSGSTTTWVLKSALTLPTTGTPAGSAACTLPPATGVTAEKDSVTVTGTTVNARKAPSTQCDTGKTQITRGQSYARTGRYSASDGYAWYRVTISGSPYWVRSDLVEVNGTVTPAPTPAPTPTPSEEAKPATKTMYTKAALHLRTAAGSTKLVSTLLKGTKVTVTGSKGTWSSVTAGSAKGWVDSAKLVAKKPAAVKTSTLQTKAAITLRAAASSSGKAGKKLAKGTKVTVVDSTGSWRAVKAGSSSGWMPASKLVKVSAKKTMQTTTSLNLRTKASTSSKIITTLKKGTKVTVTSSSGVWRKVTVGSRTGWVHGKYLKAVSTTAAKKNVKTTTAAVNLRAKATTSSKSLTVLKKGTKVTVTSSSGVWRKVTVGSRTGWVHGNYLK